MKKIVFCISFILTGICWGQTNSIPVAPYLPAQAAATAPITVQHPQEDMLISRGAKNIYIFGKINLPTPTLNINGQTVPVYKNGTFIAFVPVKQGNFTLLLTATSQGKTYQALRHIQVPGKPIHHFTGKAHFDEKEIYPSKPLWAKPGDTITLSARGTPRAEVYAVLSGLKNAKHIPLKERANSPGSYQGKYTIRENEKARQVKITYHLEDPASKTHTKITAKQRLKILATDFLQTARIQEPGTKLRQLPVQQGSLYPFYRAFGTVFIDGRDNDLYRLHLRNGEFAWLEEQKLTLTSATVPPNQLTEIETIASPQSTQIRWDNTRQVPVSVHEFNNRIEVTFYYTDTFEENFNFDATSPLIERIEWKEPQEGVLPFIIYLKDTATLWGHSYRYDNTHFILELKHAPTIHPTAAKPLLGARILLDAGHSPKRKPPYDGLVSPSGFLEYEANLALAEVLKSKLETAGATVIMTRQGNNHLTLQQRYQKALAEQAHIFISLHHNALPDTVNPMARPRGYSIYYTYPHSFELANHVYQSFNKKIPLPDNGLIANDILFIPRIAEMPSILIENAFMILPQQEELVMSSKGRELFAQTIYEGIRQFYNKQFPRSKSTKNKK